MTVHGGNNGVTASRTAAAGPRPAMIAGQVDAELLLSVTARLRGAFGGLSQAPLSEARRARWQSRLVDISRAAQQDLWSAVQQLDRFEDEFRRETAA